jgi:hypothetical protein
MRDHAVQCRRGANIEPKESIYLFGLLKQASAERPAPDGQKDDFNCVANWMKHGLGADEVEIEEWVVTMWLNRAISKFRAVYGIGTPEMTGLFPWAGQARGAVGNGRPGEPPHTV